MCMTKIDKHSFQGTVAGLQNMHADTHTRFRAFFCMCISETNTLTNNLFGISEIHYLCTPFGKSLAKWTFNGDVLVLTASDIGW